jgi:hypothetical protein
VQPQQVAPSSVVVSSPLIVCSWINHVLPHIITQHGRVCVSTELAADVLKRGSYFVPYDPVEVNTRILGMIGLRVAAGASYCQMVS